MRADDHGETAVYIRVAFEEMAVPEVEIVVTHTPHSGRRLQNPYERRTSVVPATHERAYIASGPSRAAAGFSIPGDWSTTVRQH